MSRRCACLHAAATDTGIRNLMNSLSINTPYYSMRILYLENTMKLLSNEIS